MEAVGSRLSLIEYMVTQGKKNKDKSETAEKGGKDKEKVSSDLDD